MDLGLQGNVAIVTGSSRGLGRAIALGLAAEGCRVVLCARGEEKLREAEAEVSAAGAEVLAVVADIAKAEDAERLVTATVDRFGRIDILVNNAGGSFAGDSEEAWDGAYSANIAAAARCSRAVLPHMRRQGSGVIVHVASIWGREAGGHLTYNAMKAAMISHAKNLALQEAKNGIRVNSVAPGSISFEGGSWWRRQQEDPEGMARFVQENIATGRFGRADEVANVVVFLCSGRASWVTGACVNIDGGQTRSNI